jgi:hypothetical protein
MARPRKSRLAVIHYIGEWNFGWRLIEYVYKGLHMVTLENEMLAVTVLAAD